MFDSVAKDGKLIHAKLTAILHAVNSQIFHDSYVSIGWYSKGTTPHSGMFNVIFAIEPSFF